MKEGFLHGRCPKCGGNIYVDRDIYGWHGECLQCGYSHDLPSIVEVKTRIVSTNSEQTAVQ
ncbi:MAG: hypothetical protein Q7R57_08275 [Dehalococcoidales bacterium]|nr:hypothetical protein [Dehalococcoidales bacterium]